ncbi:MAG: hypothetical protein K6F84_02925, partial [Lachnospiraceae bacterium]|nr:hypothetical protein [Lachnospiraceae bacterium]
MANTSAEKDENVSWEEPKLGFKEGQWLTQMQKVGHMKNMRESQARHICHNLRDLTLQKAKN